MGIQSLVALGIQSGLLAGRPTTPFVGQTFAASDNGHWYLCLVAGAWIDMGTGGGGGSPGGSNTQLQYNNSSAFGGISGATSDGTNVTFGSGNLRATSPQITTGVNDANGNSMLAFTATGSAVNGFTATNAATGNPAVVSLAATGSSTNVAMNLASKGTGAVGVNASTVLGTYTSTAFVVHATTDKNFWLDNSTKGCRIGVANDAFTTVTSLSLSVTNFYLMNAAGTQALMNFTQAGNQAYASGGILSWSSSATQADTTLDTGIARNTAGVLEVNNGSANTYRDLKVRQHFVDQTITAGGTTGNQTINKAAGTVNFAASATAITVTNSLVTTSSTIYCSVRTNDATATIKNVVPSSGSFVITLSAAATAETSVGFLVIN